MVSLGDGRHSVAGLKRWWCLLWFVHSELFVVQDNNKRRGGGGSKHIIWLDSRFRPECIVTAIAHIGFPVFYPCACVSMSRWLCFVGCYLFLEITHVSDLRWLQFVRGSKTGGISESTSPRVYLGTCRFSVSLHLFLILGRSPGLRPTVLFPPAVAADVTLWGMFPWR